MALMPVGDRTCRLCRLRTASVKDEFDVLRFCTPCYATMMAEPMLSAKDFRARVISRRM